MARAPYYTPQLDRDLVTSLYHLAKTRRIPMTRLASSLVREGLARTRITPFPTAARRPFRH